MRPAGEEEPAGGVGRKCDEVIDCSVSEFVPCFAVSFVSPFPVFLFLVLFICLIGKMTGDDEYAARFDDCVDDEKQQ